MEEATIQKNKDSSSDMADKKGKERDHMSLEISIFVVSISSSLSRAGRAGSIPIQLNK